ncbi:voltage-gated chloride channel protein [Oscillospiraceae bacterium HV4-5-C5C]|nr:voltage-gated chloride channel protein [Oscillospiraceae bacterium HV4-5-C5C]
MNARAAAADWRDTLSLTLAALLTGLFTGAADALFGRVLLAVSAFRDQHVSLLLPFLPLAGLLIIWAYESFGSNSRQGMELVFKAGRDPDVRIPLRLIPFSIGATWLTHLFGGSAGREGVAVQIGATASHFVGRKMRPKDAAPVLLAAGMAAGFAGLYQTPIAAVFFALEVMVAGKLEYKALLPALVSAYTACATSALFGLEKFSFDLSWSYDLSLSVFARLLLLGACIGLGGSFFASGLHWGKAFLARRIKNPLLRILLTALPLSWLLLLLYHGRYAGLGTNLISLSLSGQGILPFDWLLKLLLTLLTLSVGFQGGEVTPLFAIGASLGAVLAPLLGLPVAAGAALGYAAMFGAATNTLLAPLFIGAEVFGWQNLPAFMLVCGAAYVFNLNHSIYALQSILTQETRNH